MVTRAYQDVGHAYQGTGQFAYQGATGSDYPGYPFQGPKVTYTGPGPRRTAPTLAIKLYTPAYRHTHGRGY